MTDSAAAVLVSGRERGQLQRPADDLTSRGNAARAVEGLSNNRKDAILQQLHVGTERMFAAAGFREVSPPTARTPPHRHPSHARSPRRPSRSQGVPGPVYVGVGGRSNPIWRAQAAQIKAALPQTIVDVYPERHHLDLPHHAEAERLCRALIDAWNLLPPDSPSHRRLPV
jgi:hypothetical protein